MGLADRLGHVRADAEAMPHDSAKDRVYRNRDEINVSKEGLGDLYESKLKGFFSFVFP